MSVPFEIDTDIIDNNNNEDLYIYVKYIQFKK